MTCLHSQMYIPCFTVTIVLKMERKQGRKSFLGSCWKRGEEEKEEKKEKFGSKKARMFSIEDYQQTDPRQQGDKKRLRRTSEESGKVCLDFCSTPPPKKNGQKGNKRKFTFFSCQNSVSGQAWQHCLLEALKPLPGGRAFGKSEYIFSLGDS